MDPVSSPSAAPIRPSSIVPHSAGQDAAERCILTDCAKALLAMPCHQENPQNRSVLEAMCARLTEGNPLEGMTLDVELRYAPGEVAQRWFSPRSDPACFAAMYELVSEAYTHNPVFRGVANARLAQLRDPLNARPAPILKPGNTYGTTVTPEQIRAAGGQVIIQLVLDPQGNLEPVAGDISAKRAAIHELVHDATGLVDEPGLNAVVLTTNLICCNAPDFERPRESYGDCVTPGRALEGITDEEELRDQMKNRHKGQAFRSLLKFPDVVRHAIAGELPPLPGARVDPKDPDGWQALDTLLGKRCPTDEDMIRVTKALDRVRDTYRLPALEAACEPFDFGLNEAAAYDKRFARHAEDRHEKETKQAQTDHEWMATCEQVRERASAKCESERTIDRTMADALNDAAKKLDCELTYAKRDAFGPVRGPTREQVEGYETIEVTKTYVTVREQGTLMIVQKNGAVTQTDMQEEQAQSAPVLVAPGAFDAGARGGDSGSDAPAVTSPPEFFCRAATTEPEVRTYQCTELVRIPRNYGDKTPAETLARAGDYVGAAASFERRGMDTTVKLSTDGGYFSSTKSTWWESKAAHTSVRAVGSSGYGRPTGAVTCQETPGLTGALQERIQDRTLDRSAWQPQTVAAHTGATANPATPSQELGTALSEKSMELASLVSSGAASRWHDIQSALKDLAPRQDTLGEIASHLGSSGLVVAMHHGSTAPQPSVTRAPVLRPQAGSSAQDLVLRPAAGPAVAPAQGTGTESAPQAQAGLLSDAITARSGGAVNSAGAPLATGATSSATSPRPLAFPVSRSIASTPSVLGLPATDATSSKPKKTGLAGAMQKVRGLFHKSAPRLSGSSASTFCISDIAQEAGPSTALSRLPETGSPVHQGSERITPNPYEKKIGQLLADQIGDEIRSLVSQVTICDRPTVNANGLDRYEYDGNQTEIRRRRVAVARQFDLTLSDAAFDRRFVTALAEEIEKTPGMPGQCGEMAALAGMKLRETARASSLNTYTLQLPDYNHTIVLLSKNHYSSKQRIDWNQEVRSKSLVVDLWQGALTPDKPEALVSESVSNRYTKDNPRAIVQCRL